MGVNPNGTICVVSPWQAGSYTLSLLTCSHVNLRNQPNKLMITSYLIWWDKLVYGMSLKAAVQSNLWPRSFRARQIWVLIFVSSLDERPWENHLASGNLCPKISIMIKRNKCQGSDTEAGMSLLCHKNILYVYRWCNIMGKRICARGRQDRF